YAEARPPEESAAVLHAFFSTATRIVEAEGGVIEAFQGDAIIAVWNGDPAHAHGVGAHGYHRQPSGRNDGGPGASHPGWRRTGRPSRRGGARVYGHLP